jgi:hypothetical protein
MTTIPPIRTIIQKNKTNKFINWTLTYIPTPTDNYNPTPGPPIVQQGSYIHHPSALLLGGKGPILVSRLQGAS